MNMWKISVVVVLVLLPLALGDTPANCTYEEMSGNWTFYIGSAGHDNTLDCSGNFPTVSKVTVHLVWPDVAKDDKGNTGFWTIIYNQGSEVVINQRKYFAFSNYTTINKTTAVSHCSSTLNGWSHKVDGTDWACYYGVKAESGSPSYIRDSDDELDLEKVYVKNLDFVKEINSHTNLWTAVHYPEMEGMTLGERLGRAGGTSPYWPFPSVSTPSLETKQLVKGLPSKLDWREMKGKNYVTPIRNQGTCGSCYAFASMAMLESRLMIKSKNTINKVFSPQDIVDCSEYSQGCAGGFPYLIAGKYAEDFGIVEENCYPYLGRDSKCVDESKCKRYRATDYQYVGGYFGACSEEKMMMALQDGPVSVAFEVTDDFQHYKTGIYKHTGLKDGFNPFRLTNHAVLAVGYGEDNGVKYWIVKNSWGDTWGESGYFRIMRGTNELNIESMAIVSTPVMPK